MKKTKFMSLIAILLMFVVALTCGFLFACGSNDDEDEVTDQDIVEEDPTTSTDPTDPTEPTDPTDPTEPSESNEDVLLSIYDGTAENFGGNNCYADFRNLHELSVEMMTAEDGSTVYAIDGMATLMTKSQIYAFNAGENEDGAKTGDAFIIVEIAAPEGSTINYNGVEVEVTDDPTDGVFIQKITGDGATERSVTVTYADGTPVSFVISLEKITIPSDYIIGTWSATEVEIELSYSSGSINITSATVTMEMSFESDGTFTLEISDIASSELDSVTGEAIIGAILSAIKIDITGTWQASEGGYTVEFDIDEESGSMIMNEGGDLAVELAEAENGELCLTMSFSVTYVSMSMPITVTEAVLGAGALD